MKIIKGICTVALSPLFLVGWVAAAAAWIWLSAGWVCSTAHEEAK